VLESDVPDLEPIARRLRGSRTGRDAQRDDASQQR
jgi:hypothetical protein